MNYKYPVSKPSLNGREKEYLMQAIESGWISSGGPFVTELEEKFSTRHLADHGVACSSGTNALILALRAIGIKPGDEVIVPEFTMIASAWAVTVAGGTPVFVDCGEDLLINVSKIEEAITEKTRAIMPVHIYGRQCDMDTVMQIAHDYGLRIIEDSCEAHGVPIRGDVACFSFYANKIITSGEGGICITNDPYLAEQMKHLRGMAFSDDHSFLHKKLAYNFRMTNMQAAVALAQTERLEEMLEKRDKIEEWYDEDLKDIEKIHLMPKRQVLWMYDILVPFKMRDGLREFLKNEGIETRLFFKPMSQQPMYRSHIEPRALLAYKMSLEGLYLPTYTDLEREDVTFISGKVREYMTRPDFLPND